MCINCELRTLVLARAQPRTPKFVYFYLIIKSFGVMHLNCQSGVVVLPELCSGKCDGLVILRLGFRCQLSRTLFDEALRNFEQVCGQLT